MKKLFALFLLIMLPALAFGQPYKQIVYYTQSAGSPAKQTYSGNNTTQPDSVWAVLTGTGPYAGKIGGVSVDNAMEQSASTIALLSTGAEAIANWKQVGGASLMQLLPVQASGDSAIHVLTSQGANTQPTWSLVPLASGMSGVLPLANGGTALNVATRTALQDSIGIPRVFYLKNDSTITAQSLTGIFQWAVDTQEVWQVEVAILDSSSSNTGVEFGITVPSGTTVGLVGGGTTTALTAWTADIIKASATAGTAVSTVASSTNYALYQTQGLIKTGATSGTAVFGGLKVSSGTLVAKANGCYLVITRLK